VEPRLEYKCDDGLAEHFSELPDLTGLTGTDAKELLESFWSGLYDQIPEDFFHCEHVGSGFTWEVLAKAKPDECFQGVGNPANRTDPVLGFDANYPGDLNAGQMQMCREIVVDEQYPTPSDSGLAQPKVNQAYVWGLTRERSAPCNYREGNLWFGTIPNTHCLVLSGFLDVTAPSLNNSWVCEGGIADFRPPRAFYYNTEDNGLHEATQAILDGGIEDNVRLRSTIGLRSAGSANGVVFLGGIGALPAGVNLFAFGEETKAYLGSASFPDYNNIRQWRLIGQELYVGVGLSSGGGEVLRWTGSVGDPFQFETVGQIAGDPAYLTPHEGRIFASSWPNGPGQKMAIWMSPKLGSDQKLTDEDAAQWQSVWTISEYDPEQSVVFTTGGGALMSYGSHLYWGTMHVPGLSLLAWQGIYGDTASEEDATAAILGTYRPISIFRAGELGTSEQHVELLYGNRFLPAYSPAQGWQIVPNNMGQGPQYGLAGFNNFFNNYTWWMEVFDGRLFVGTMDFLYLAGELLGDTLEVPEVPEVISEAFEHFAGADLWRFDSSCHRARPVSLSGVGNISSYGVRTMVSDDALYLGMANPMNLLTDPNDDLPEGGWELIELTSTED
jgi:hypothetical protein